MINRRVIKAFCIALLAYSTGCSRSHITSISEAYRLRSVVVGFGDGGWTISLEGHPNKQWLVLWPSLPVCDEGRTWIFHGNDLVFVGWSKRPIGPADRRLLITRKAGPPADLTDKVVALCGLERRIS